MKFMRLTSRTTPELVVEYPPYEWRPERPKMRTPYFLAHATVFWTSEVDCAKTIAFGRALL